MNLTEIDIEFLAKKGISSAEVEDQIAKISKGVNVPNIIRTASLDDGILIFNDSEKENFIQCKMKRTYETKEKRKILSNMSSWVASQTALVFGPEPDLDVL